MLYIGPHTHKNKGDVDKRILEDYEECKLINKNLKVAIQIFILVPAKYNEWISINENKISKIVKQNKIKLFVHSNYMAVPWKYNKNSINLIKQQLIKCNEIGAIGLVIHLPSDTPENIAKVMIELVKNKPLGIRIILEPTAKKPINNMTYESPEMIDKLIIAIKAEDISSKDFGICLDSSHIHSGGVKLTSYKQSYKFLNKIKHKKNIKLFHLNDNNFPIGSGKDNHNNLGVGTIWNKDNSGIKPFIEFASQYKVPIILERNGTDLFAPDLNMIKDIIN